LVDKNSGQSDTTDKLGVIDIRGISTQPLDITFTAKHQFGSTLSSLLIQRGVVGPEVALSIT